MFDQRGIIVAVGGAVLLPSPDNVARMTGSVLTVVWLSWIFTADLLNDILSAGFRVRLVSMHHTPSEKVIKIDDNGFQGDVGTRVEPLHRSFGGFQPLGVGVREVACIREQSLDTGPISLAIPGYAHHDGGTGLFRWPLFQFALLTSSTVGVRPKVSDNEASVHTIGERRIVAIHCGECRYDLDRR